MDAHTRWFRRLLRLLPSDFQADYARDMERTFHAQQHEARGRGVRALAGLWWDTARDVVRTAPREHLDQARQDARYAARMMRKHLAFTAVAVLVLAGGIGITSAVVTLVDASVLRPLPFPAADRLIAVREKPVEDVEGWELSYPAFLDVRRESRAFERFDGYMLTSFLIPAGSHRRLVEGVHVSAGFVETLGVRLAAGRPFRADEDRPGAPRAAIVSHAVAVERFGDAHAAIGRPLVVDDRPAAVVGVLPAGFAYPAKQIEVWMPLGLLAGEPWIQDRSVHVVLPVGRLRADATLESARADLSRQMTALQAAYPGADPNHQFIARPLAQQVSAAARPAVIALAGAVAVLLLVTCTSVGLLLLNRAMGRSGEMSMRMALGASRTRLVRQLLTESALLAAVAALPAVVAAHVVLRLLVAGFGDMLPSPRTPEITIDAALVIAGVALLAAAVCGASPAAHVMRVPRTPGAVGAAGRSRWPSSMLAGQVALSCVLVLLAILLGRSFAALVAVNPGFPPERLLLMRATLPPPPPDRPAQAATFFRSLPGELAQLPGVIAATAASRPPIGGGYKSDLTVEGAAMPAAPVVNYRRVLPGYFEALGIPLRQGRAFTDRDGHGEPVVIVSETLARRYLPPGRAIGHRIKTGPADREQWLRVIGVVADVRNAGLDATGDLTTYEPHAQRPWNGMTLMVRTAASAEELAPVLEKKLRALEPGVILTETETMEARIATSVASRRFQMGVVATFAGATLLLAALALYGVRAWQVRVHRRDLGVRAAMGASSIQLTMHVMREGVLPAALGAAIGLAAAAAAAYAIRGLLFAVTPSDPASYALTAVVMIATAAVASWIPARRAATIDPSEALRTE